MIFQRVNGTDWSGPRCELVVAGTSPPRSRPPFPIRQPVAEFGATINGCGFPGHRQSVTWTFVMMNSITSPRAVGSELIARLAGTRWARSPARLTCGLVS